MSDENISHYEMWAGDLHIEITGPSTKFFGQDLLTAAIVALIEDADSHGWEKERVEKYGWTEDTPADQFYAAILSAVARHYAVDARLDHDAQINEILFRLIGELTGKGRLMTIVPRNETGERDGEE